MRTFGDMGGSNVGRIAAASAATVLLAIHGAAVGVAGQDPPVDESDDLWSGTWTGAIFFDGTRTSSGLSAVGQQTDIFQRIDAASIGLTAAVGSGDGSDDITSGTSDVSIAWSESGTFAVRTVAETGTLQVTGDISRIEVAGTLARALSASDSEGNPLGSQSGTRDVDVRWVFDLVDLTCGLAEYRLSEDSRGESILWYAQRPRVETDSVGFDIVNDLTVRALLKAPGGPDFVDLAVSLQIMEEVIATIVADPTGQNVQTLLLELRVLEDLRSKFIAAGTCVSVGQATFLAGGLTVLQELITQMIGVVLQQDDVPLDVLVDVLGIGVRTGAISPGSGGPGGDLYDAVGVELGEQLGVAVAADDVDAILDIYVVAVQYGYGDVITAASAALDQIGAGG